MFRWLLIYANTSTGLRGEYSRLAGRFDLNWKTPEPTLVYTETSGITRIGFGDGSWLPLLTSVMTCVW